MQQSKLDNVINQLIDRARGGKNGTKGFVLDLAADGREEIEEARRVLEAAKNGDGENIDLQELVDALGRLDDALARTSIEVKQSLPPRDEYEKPVDWRAHEIRDTESFVRYAQRYGSADRSLIMFSVDGCTLTLDEQVERGDREVIRYPFEASEDRVDWGRALGKEMSHRDLLRFLMNHEHNLDDAEVLKTLRTLKVKATVDIDSDVQDDGEKIGIVFNNGGDGESLKKFKRRIGVTVPVLAQDITDAGAWLSTEVRLEVALPDEPNKPPKFSLHCSTWDQLLRRRAAEEGESIRQALGDGWAVIHGKHNTRERVIGVDAGGPAEPPY